MNRFAALAAALFVAAASTTALADPGHGARAGHGERAEPKFPVPAAEFRARVEARQTHAKERLEARIAKKQLPAAEADKLRADYEAAVAKVRAKVDEVCADGAVTKEEAHEVRALARATMPHHGHRDRGAQRGAPNR